jgi:hypothetical protein
MPRQQQPFEAGLAQCGEPLPAARDDPQKHGSPQPNPIAIRQVMTNRIGRPKEATTETSKDFLGIQGRGTSL